MAAAHRPARPGHGQVSQTAAVDRWEAATNLGADRGGLAFTLVGGDGVRYYGSHLAALAWCSRGSSWARSGRPARRPGTSCHLHHGLSPAECGPDDWFVRRGVVSPYPYLRAWVAGRDAFPAVAVGDWHERNGCPTEADVYP